MSVPLVEIAECCDIVSGATPSTSVDDYWDGDICWATPKDLSELGGHYISDTPRKITAKGLASCAATVLPANSVLFSSRAPIGHVAINTVPMATNQGFKSLVPKGDQADAKYLFHWLKANRGHLESLGNGATFKELSKSTLSRVKIPLPPLAQQRRIATILDLADTIRAKRREALALLDHLAQAVFIEMFGERQSNPKSWTKLPIGSVALVSTGGTPSRSKQSYFGGTIPWVKTTELVGEAIADTEEKLTDAGLHAIRGKLHPKGSVLVAMYGQGQTRGRCGLLEMPASCNQACGVIYPSDHLEPHFLFWQLRIAYQHIRALGRGGNQENLNLQLLKAFEILVPPLEFQRKFVEISRVIDSIRLKELAALNNADALFSSLQHRAFQGGL